MAKAVPKITLSASRDIPFNKLVLSQANVRRLQAGVSVEELAEDIARRSLLQALNVRPVLDADGAETGMFEIPAGGRRYRALERLVQQKRLSKTALIPCVVRDPGALTTVEEDSLAENAHRVALHPLDQFRAFKTLHEQGAGEEEIAARFFVTPAVVKQRLRLASVSANLLDIYAEDGMTLEQLMAFTVTTDQARQEQVWEALQSYNREPYLIRRQLTESAVRATDRRARFVGLESYEAAGGAVLRDLFEDDGGGWLQDVALLDRLATEKLAAEAQNVATEGWKWIEVAVDFRYGHANHLRHLPGEPVELSAEEQATFDALTAEYAKLESDYEGADELPDDVDTRLGEIETAFAAFDNRSLRYDPAEIVRAGVFVSIDADGTLAVDRGYVRPQDEPSPGTDGAVLSSDGAEPSTSSSQATVITVGGVEAEEEGEDDSVRPLPEKASQRAHRSPYPRTARCRRRQSAGRAHGAAAQALPRHLPARRARRLLGSLGAACILPRPGDGSEGQCLCQGGRRAARSLEGRVAKGRHRALGLAHGARRRQARCASRALRFVRRQRSLREGETVMAARVFRCVVSSSASPSRIGLPSRSASTW